MRTIVALKGKLVHIDNVTPLLLELVGHGILKNVLFVLPSKLAHETLTENPALDQCLSGLGKIVYLRSGKAGQHKMVRAARLLVNFWTLRSYFLGPVLSLEIEESPLFTLLTAFNRRVFRGKRVFMLLSNLPFQLQRKVWRHINTAFDRKFSVNIGKCDGVLSSHTRCNLEEMGTITTASNAPWLEVGYVRGFPKWRSHLKETRQTVRCGAEDKVNIFFPLTVLHRVEPNGREYKIFESVEAIIDVLGRFGDRIHTVFRYHPTTDKAHFLEILNRTGLKSFEISDDHPLRLIDASNMVITTSGSTLIADAWFLERPTIEYSRSSATPERDSIYDSVTDFFILDDEDELYKVIDQLSSGEIRVKRDSNKKALMFPVPDGNEMKDLLQGIIKN